VPCWDHLRETRRRPNRGRAWSNFARVAWETAKPPCSVIAKFNKHLLTQPLLSMLCVMRYEESTWRGTDMRPAERSELCRAPPSSILSRRTTLYRLLRRLENPLSPKRPRKWCIAFPCRSARQIRRYAGSLRVGSLVISVVLTCDVCTFCAVGIESSGTGGFRIVAGPQGKVLRMTCRRCLKPRGCVCWAMPSETKGRCHSSFWPAQSNSFSVGSCRIPEFEGQLARCDRKGTYLN